MQILPFNKLNHSDLITHTIQKTWQKKANQISFPIQIKTKWQVLAG